MRGLLRTASSTYESFSQSGRALFLFFAAVSLLSSVSLVYLLNESLLVATPAYGGSLSEGLIGSPRFINPVLAISDSDHDLTSLVYSGLLKAAPSGDYVPDLAQSYTVSPDGKTYTFVLRPNATFHDGTPVTADDVVFTIGKAQDPALKSPQLANWEGVTVSEVDAHTVEFTLKSPYAPFIENVTLGILPKHLWQNVSDDEFSFSDLNTEPVGSGPFKVSSISRSNSGIPSSYELSAFSGYTLGRPYLDSLTLKFYQDESGLVGALKSGDIEAASGISPASLTALKNFNIDNAPLNRVFAVFFNQNQSTILRDHDVRQALEDAIDRQALVAQVLGGYGTPITGPLPPSVLNAPQMSASTTSSADLALAAQQELIKKGWILGANGVLAKTTGKGKSASTETLQFSLATDNVPELVAAAQYLKQVWSKMGAQVTVQIYDQGDLSQNVIRPRKYDALLFGEVIGREADLFAFWDSSQRNDPGLNIAEYTNATADKLLEELRTTADDATRQQLYAQFNAQLQKDIPAIFLYTPDFVYIVPNDIRGLTLGFIETPSDRFLSSPQWHIETDYVWPIFLKHQ
ncbi:MAG: peptide ABC transporter substrate-binding protein [Patescibacteria group bacterium]|nr:peptide ABC transporter substrate-binding protein [Patescibacteria group bacterium]